MTTINVGWLNESAINQGTRARGAMNEFGLDF